MKRAPVPPPMKRIVPLLLLLGLLAAACISPQPDATATVDSPQATETPPAATAAPSPTPGPGTVLLVVVDESTASVASALEATAASLAADSGLQFERRSAADLSALPEPLTLAILYRPAAEQINELLSQGVPPQKVVAIAPQSESGDGGVLVLAREGLRPDREAFLAGYSAAVLSSNYRVAVVFAEGISPAGSGSAFLHGARYYCGLCRAAYPPFAEYPASVRLSGEIGDTQLASAVQQLADIDARSAYLTPGLENSGLAAALAENGLLLLARTRPAEIPDQNWLAAVRPGPERALLEYWPELLEGSQPSSDSMPLAVSDRNPQLFSDARFRLVEEVWQDLEDGFVNTGVSPQ